MKVRTKCSRRAASELIANADGGFFVFGDLSIRTLGKHRLVFSLFELRK